MILIPWYIRLGIDTLMFTAPFIFISNYPLLIWEIAEFKNRLMRKKNFEDVQILEKNENCFKSVMEVRKLYEEMGFDEEF